MQQVAEYNYDDFKQTQQQEQDATLLVKFFIKSCQDTGASATQGRPVFREKEYIDIRIPGDRDGVARPATHRDRERFPKHYAAFQQRIEAPEEGTPLTEWGPISRSLADEMAFHNIKTVEQLANVSDTLCQNFMGAAMFKQKAQQWLEHTKQDVTVQDLRDELAQRDAQLATMQAQIDQLMGALADGHDVNSDSE